ncbi:MAG: protein kinase [Sideroxydans sp.]|nr:protein kinase [Sideroxydans sp.]
MHTLHALQTGQLAGITRLDLAAGLTQFPHEIFTLADSLEILNLSGNQLSSLPSDLPRLHKLRILFCSDNCFTHLPEVLGQCANLEMIGFKANQIQHLPAAALPPKLRWLILTDNQLTLLPAQLGQCTQLQKLMLAGNRLQALPDELAGCSRLELLRIAANQLKHLPDFLWALPNLSWLAYAGNPFSDAWERAAMQGRLIPHIDWHSLKLQQVLGQGASGIIYRAHRRSEQGNHPVAVKLFKGALTSDGLPRSEKAACIAAGEHPHLIPIHGKISAHPEGELGLVMSLIASEFVTLANPPSLQTCTRDVYAPSTRFSLAVALRIAQGIAQAAQHLHTRGVLHGDLYAHNILWNVTGECLLGDFGAASFLPPDDVVTVMRLQKIEVRAFGCLLEELLQCCDAKDALLQALQQRCLHVNPEVRPSWGEIQACLAEYSAAGCSCETDSP